MRGLGAPAPPLFSFADPFNMQAVQGWTWESQPAPADPNSIQVAQGWIPEDEPAPADPASIQVFY
jgi:hypothetical protein